MTQVRDKEQSCKERVREHLNGRMKDLRKLWKAYQSGKEEVPDLGSFHEYGLAFDYVAPGTFTDQERGYFRYQLSWGGPSDEFRIFTDENLKPTSIEYWFLDWYDGANIKLGGKALALLLELWDFWGEIGSVDAALKAAKE